MACFCEDCRLYFQRRYPNCPRCGRRPVSDGRTDQELEALGYHAFPLPGQAGQQPRRAAIEDEDLLSRLRRDYERQYTAPPPEPAAQAPDAPPPSPPPEEDFFGGFREGPAQSTPRIDLDPPERPAVRRPAPREAPAADWYAPPRARRESVFSRLGRSASSVPWPLLLRIGFVVLIVALLFTLWAMRRALVRGVLSIFTALLPALVVLYLLWYIIRGGRRR